MMPSPGDITVLLREWDSDRKKVLEALTPVVYGELRKIAASYLRRQRPDHTLQPTALINEAYLRLVKQESADFNDRSHFYALAARMMRQILVDAVRAQKAEKRGGSDVKLQLDQGIDIAQVQQNSELEAVHEALEKLHAYNPRVAQSVELRYFGGLELKEIAETLSTSLATVKRDLTLGEAWLRRALTQS